MSDDNNGCTGEEIQKEWQLETKQATPFNIGTFGVLLVFCIITALTSSLYYNWPAVERILIDDKVFQNLCTKDEILNAIDGMFVCDKQRIEIGNLALVIFYSEFVAFAIGGILTDIVGVGSVLILSFIFGFSAFITLYYCYMDNFMVKLAFALWGMFGGLVFITSIQFPKMFPQSKSLADGMIILFDNLSGLMPLVIHRIMKIFDLRYYEAFGTYILWGVIPGFLLTLSFIPSVIVSDKSEDSIPPEFKCLKNHLTKTELWTNLVVFSIPVTCSIFYKKTFSTYFLKNQTLVRLFPIIMLFVFVPTIFIAALNQFMGVHITSTILYIFYIISFVCFLYPTKQYGLLSIILFVISTSAADQQTMTYISEQHPQNESTLLGISYAVDFIVGAVLQRLFTCIFNRKPKAILLVIVPLFFICIGYSIYCHTQNSRDSNKNKVSYKAIFVILWFIPFLLLCLVLSFNYFRIKKFDVSKITLDESKITSDLHEKKTVISIMFYSFTFYYICDSFIIITSIYKFIFTESFSDHKYYGFFYFLTCFFIIPQPFIFAVFRQINVRYSNVMILSASLLLFKIVLLVFSNSTFTKMVGWLFSIFLIIYGFVFFLFIYMLAYYNFQITYVERCYKTSLLHWGNIITIFILFKLFNNILRQYEFGYLILWTFNICFFIYFVMVLYFYFPYEMDIVFNFNSSNLPLPDFSKFKLITNFNLSDFKFYNIFGIVSLPIWSIGVLINIKINKKFVFLFIISSLYDISFVLFRMYSQENNDWETYIEYLNYSLTGFSLFIFLILILGRIFVRGDNYKENTYIVFIKYLNIICTLINSSICWLKIQNELQKCCCTDSSESTCCKCCCVCKDNNKDCACCKKQDGKCCCCCCKPENENCQCDPSCCKECRESNGCQNCVCKCFKKFKITKKDPTIIFCFYDCNFEKVDEKFLKFYFETILGWIFLIIYLNISREKVLYNVLL